MRRRRRKKRRKKKRGKCCNGRFDFLLIKTWSSLTSLQSLPTGNVSVSVKYERIFFFKKTFFTFLGNPPLKIFKSKMQPLHSPSHHEHHTTVLPAQCPTQWWWFYCDWMSLVRMISSHGYRNYNCLPPPTSKPSCDRYTQPPQRKPTPPCSPDDALQARISIMAS